ncbi:MAG: nucleotide pyrophosphohydrolase [Actinomycetota bacterium]
MDSILDVGAVQAQLRTFAAERDWERFHSPKNIVMALAGETGELVEVFQWLTERESEGLSVEQKAAASEEIADIVIYLLRLADLLDISIAEAVQAKMQLNAKTYPVDLAKGNAAKRSREDAS